MFSVAVISQTIGFVVLGIALPFLPGHPKVADVLWGAAAGLCGGIGIALLYHALSIGRMGVVSPLTAVLSAALPVAAGLWRGEGVGTIRLAGIGAALLAVVLISMSSEPDGRREFSLTGVREAALSGVILGGFYICIGNTHASAGLYQLFAARAASIAFLTIVALIAGRSLIPARGSLGMIVGAGAIDMTANVLFVVATYLGYLSIAAVLTSLYPAATVFWAFVLLKERLAPVQMAGAALALAGVVLIAV